jgi:hypothetical protein
MMRKPVTRAKIVPEEKKTTEEMRRLAHEIHFLSIRIDQNERIEASDDVILEAHQDLQVVAHELADQVLDFLGPEKVTDDLPRA